VVEMMFFLFLSFFGEQVYLKGRAKEQSALPAR
jgi:hypothetical protein